MKSVAISQVDALFANGSYPIEFLFLYERGFSTKKLRRALRALARHFWPVFGELGQGRISFRGFREEEFFDEEDAGHTLDLEEMGKGGEAFVDRFTQGPLRTLFFLKVIRFRNALVLVPKMNHVAGDGYSYFLFLSALAALSRSPFVTVGAPFVRAVFKLRHRRTGLREFQFLSEGPPPVTGDGRLALETIEIPKRDVQALVRAAAATGGLHISSNDVLSAMVMKKLAGLQGHRQGAGFRLTIPIDVRGRVREYGRHFFGNGIMLHTADLGPDRPAGSSLEDTAVRIRRAMPRVSAEAYVRYLAGIERIIAEKTWDELRPYDPDRGCLVTNLSKLPAERLDFGTGGPAAVIPLTVEKNSAAILSRQDRYVIRLAYGIEKENP